MGIILGIPAASIPFRRFKGLGLGPQVQGSGFRVLSGGLRV